MRQKSLHCSAQLGKCHRDKISCHPAATASMASCDITWNQAHLVQCGALARCHSLNMTQICKLLVSTQYACSRQRTASCRQHAQGRSPRRDPQPVLAQMASPQLAAADGAVALNTCTCTMEQLPLGGTAWNACTMEQLPSGRNPVLPLTKASPVQHGASSPASAKLANQGKGRVPVSPGRQQVSSPGPVSLTKPGQGYALTLRPQQDHEGCQATEQGQGQGPKHTQGLRQGLRGAGLFARSAAAALCSARRETAEPRNPYRLVILNDGFIQHAFLLVY